MSIDEKLSDMEIKKVLIVDDKTENINAAKQYFKSIPAKTEYATNSDEAIKKIKESYDAEAKYDLVITDLKMETKTAGIDVVKEAILNGTYATIATGANYDKSENDPHGPTTTIRPSGDSIRSKKDKPETWTFALEKSLDHIANYKTSPEAKALQRYEKYVGKISTMPEQIIELFTEKYK